MTVPAQFDAIGGGEEIQSWNAAYFQAFGLAVVNNNLSAPGVSYNSTTKKWYFYGGGSVAGYYSYFTFSGSAGFSATRMCGAVALISSLSGTGYVSLLNAAGNAQIQFMVNANGSISAKRGSSVLATSKPNVAFLNSEIKIEWDVTIDASSGALTVWANGDTDPVIGPLTGVNTENDSSSVPLTSVRIGGNESYSWRDLYVHDGSGAAPFNGRLPLGGMVWLPAVALVSNSGFAPNSGSDLIAMLPTPPNTSTKFDTAGAAGDAMTVTLAQLPANVLNVLGVRAIDQAWKTDTGARALQKTLTIGGTASVGAAHYLSQSPLAYPDGWLLADPSTGNLFYGEGATGVVNVNGTQLTETLA